MSYISHLRCTDCGAEYPADVLMNLCPVDNRPVEMIFDTDRLAADHPDTSWHDPSRRDMWRFGALMALDTQDPGDRQHIVTLGEGHTPLLDYGDFAPAAAAGIDLVVKDEGKAHAGFGANPTQSFKDRGMAMAISMAKKMGVEKLAIPTQGNAGDSLCEYALAAGMGAVVAMPDNTPMPILGRVAALAQAREDFHLELVQGLIREAGELLKRDWIPKGWFNCATFQEPGWRIDGKKSMGLELAEPAPGTRNWSLPDVVIYPTGGGTGLLGMWKAWGELEALGVIGSDRPRMIAVQSEVTTPLVDAWDSNAADSTPVSGGDTLAYGMNVPGGIGHFRVLEILRESGGRSLAVAEDDMNNTLSQVWKDKGWWICPEGAACLAAVPMLLDMGEISPGEKVVAFNTGSLEKYLPDLRHLL